MLQSQDEVEVEVTREDQKNINTFSCLNNRYHEIKEEIKAKKEKGEEYDYVLSELYMRDDEKVRVSVGEAFVALPKDEAISFVEASQEANNDEVNCLEKELEEISKTMANLKVVLYGKFKKSINLEED